MKKIASILAIFVSLPIWFYLLYKILVAINATELMFFLFWIYFPLPIISSVLLKLAED